MIQAGSMGLPFLAVRGLLHSDILIVENLTNLGNLPSEGFIFHAAPVKIAGAAAFPVRAYAVIS